jgi:hypothetical protein
LNGSRKTYGTDGQAGQILSQAEGEEETPKDGKEIELHLERLRGGECWNKVTMEEKFDSGVEERAAKIATCFIASEKVRQSNAQRDLAQPCRTPEKPNPLNFSFSCLSYFISDWEN